MANGVFEILSNIANAMSKFVRIDTEQSFSEEQKTTARKNIGAISNDDIELSEEQLAALKGEKGDKGDKGDPGEPGADGQDGSPGADGADGKTPVRGEDYWTDADKQEIMSDIMEQAKDVVLPTVSASDNGKILEVVNGAWVKVSVADSSVKTYVDDYIGSALEGDY